MNDKKPISNSEIKNNPFYISERMGLFPQDNLLNYNVGPLKVTLCPWSEKITVLSPFSKWNYLLNFFLETAKEAWELSEDQIFLHDNVLIIALNYETLKLYTAHAIVF